MTLARLYPILDIEMAQRAGHDVVACARVFAALGLEVQQLRAKSLSGREFLAWAERLAPVVPRLIVNDRADIARLCGAAGVHVGQFDLPAAAVRALAPVAGWILGVSTHAPTQIEAAVAAAPDYLAIGPVFTTTSKQDPDPVVGLEGVTEARRRFPGPVVAIGGITEHNAAQVCRAGADAVAVMAALWQTPDPVAAARRLLASTSES